MKVMVVVTMVVKAVMNVGGDDVRGERGGYVGERWW